MNNKKILDEALAYAYEGAYAGLSLPVFPCYSIQGDRCSCDDEKCYRQGDHPIMGADLLWGATKSKDLIMDYWRKWPTSNIAFPTGESSGIVVLEIYTEDIKNFNEILNELGFYLPSHVVGSYSETIEDEDNFLDSQKEHVYHLYFLTNKPLKSITNILIVDRIKKINLKADNDFVLLPPSVCSKNQALQWNIPINDLAYLGELPEWVSDLATKYE